jgi:hypothetical protein
MPQRDALNLIAQFLIQLLAGVFFPLPVKSGPADLGQSTHPLHT